jgi:hypothetical protein
MTTYLDKGGEVLVRKFRSRAQYWRNNSDKAWVSVKLGEIRAVVDALDRLSTP